MVIELIILGLLLDIIGVMILTVYSGKVFFWMFDKWMYSYDDEIEKTKNKLKKKLHRSTIFGVILLILGFVLQIIGNWL